MKTSIKQGIIIFTLLASGLSSPGAAQNSHWRGIKGKPLVKFDWNCAAPEMLPKASLSHLIELAFESEDPGPHYADRAFKYDLNRDGKAEYFVPLYCGATGNCTFGLFSLNPPRLLGKINGEYMYLNARTRAWPDLITYAHFTAVEGDLFTYTFRRGRYKELGRPLHTDSRGGIYGKKVPAFLEKASKGCKTVGN